MNPSRHDRQPDVSRPAGRMERRTFLAGVGVAGLSAFGPVKANAQARSAAASGREEAGRYLDQFVIERSWIDGFLDAKARVWARFDSDLGICRAAILCALVSTAATRCRDTSRRGIASRRISPTSRAESTRMAIASRRVTKSPTARPGRRFWPHTSVSLCAITVSAGLAFTRPISGSCVRNRRERAHPGSSSTSGEMITGGRSCPGAG